MLYTDKLEARLRPEGIAGEAEAMSAYMKDHFPFLGIKTPKRTALTRDFIKANGLPSREELSQVVRELWALPEREFAYSAMFLMERMRKQLVADDLALIEELIVTKPWWDTVDLLASHLVGHLLALHPELIEAQTDQWMQSGDLWLQRTCLLFQLGYKAKTDEPLLFSFIKRLKDSKEFFIRKAIGWALREYGKTNPESVRQFVAQTELSPLSAREALKHIGSIGLKDGTTDGTDG
jgi:3-methyladenine DNA glycosylase AlkD